MGMGKSGHIGKKLAATFASTGTPAIFVHPAEAGHGDLGMITSSDILLAISQSGQSDELIKLIPYFKRKSIPLIAMTGNVESPLALHATAVINTSVTQEACSLGLAPTASTTLTLALGDALAVCLLKSHEFTAEDFANTHPLGKLGRKLLLKIEDVMKTGEELPIVSRGVTIRTAIGEMSRAALGFVNIIDATGGILGVFTDGDLRRAIDNDVDIKNTPIEDAMIKIFTTIHQDNLAIEAVELMEKNKITSIPVVDNKGELVGAINMRILLQSGVV
jgi:arabinose-5-phosphate isomerase